MKTLYLPLKNGSYKMLKAGIKKEEYREINQYWITRLFKWTSVSYDHRPINILTSAGEAMGMIEDGIDTCTTIHTPRKFDAVCYYHKYSKNQMMFECKGITIGRGRKEWGAPDHETFIIKLGERIQ